jgi:TP901 family phage tail tape measure protein
MSDVVLRLTAKDDASAALNRVSGSLRDIERATDNAARSAGAFGDLMRGVAQGVGIALASAAAEGVAALGDAVKQSISVAGDFEAGLLRFAAIAGDALPAAGASLEDVRRLALDLGATTAFGAGEALAALTELVKGGVSVKDALSGATDATLALAAATQTDLASAAEIVAKQLGVWAETGVDAANVANLLTQAANASTVDVADLALGLANVGGSARVAGLSFQETVQSLALIAPYFASAADAGTSFKTFVARLVPTTKDATDMMVALGLAAADGRSVFFDAAGQFVGMERTSALLAEALRGLSEEQKALALQTIFGSDAIRAAAAIAEAGSAGYASMGAAMAASGTAAQAAAAMQQGYAHAVEQLSGAWETLQITLGSMALPALTALVGALSSGVSAATAWAQSIASADDPLLAVVGALGMSEETTRIWAEGLRAAGEAASAALTHAGGVISAALSALARATAQALDQATRWWSKHGDDVIATITPLAQSVQTFFVALFEFLSALVQTTLAAIASFWSAHGSDVTAIVQAALTLLVGVVQGALTLMTGVVQAATALLRGDWQGAMTAIQSAAQTAWGAIAAAFQTAQAETTATMQRIAQALTSAWQEAMTALQNAASAAWSAIASGIASAQASIVGAVVGIISAIRAEWDGLVSSGAAIGSALIDGVAGGVAAAAGRLAQAAADAVRNALNAAKRAVGIRSPSEVARKEVGAMIGEGMTLGLLDALPGVARAATALSAAATTPAPTTTMMAQTTVNVGGIAVHAAPGMDERALAEMVRREVDAMAAQGLASRRYARG